MSAPQPGTLYGVGVGPGDPELLTMKAVRILAAAPVIAYFAKRGRPGHARRIAGDHFNPDADVLRFEYPLTTERNAGDPEYRAVLDTFYDKTARELDINLRQGQDVAVLCEGDPFLYGSFILIYDRLRNANTVIVPGITGMGGCWSEAQTPMTRGNDVLTVLPGTLDEDALAQRLAATDAAVIMKVGRNLPKIRNALARAGAAERALYVERGTQAGARVQPLGEMTETPAPYFSLILVPGTRPPA